MVGLDSEGTTGISWTGLRRTPSFSYTARDIAFASRLHRFISIGNPTAWITCLPFSSPIKILGVNQGFSFLHRSFGSVRFGFIFVYYHRRSAGVSNIGIA